MVWIEPPTAPASSHRQARARAGLPGAIKFVGVPRPPHASDAEDSMKFRVERDALADAVAWTAKSLPSRPSVPVLAGVMLRVTDGRLHVSGFDYEVSSEVSVEVQADSDGAALVSGRLLAEITKSLRALPVEVAAVGSSVELTCGSARFTLPTMPVEDYPTLPDLPASAGTVPAGEF